MKKTKKPKRDDRIIVSGKVIGNVIDDKTFTIRYKNKNMVEPFTITASVGPKISSEEVSKLKKEDIVSVVLSEDDLHKGVIIKTPYGK